MSWRASLLSVCLTAGLASSAPTSWAQDPPPYEPPTMRFDQPIRLMDAVRLTLQHEPNIKLQDQNARLRRGVFQEQSGLFDLSLTGGFSYDYNVSELRESQQQQERENRLGIERAIPQTEALVTHTQNVYNSLVRQRDGVNETIPDPLLESQLDFIRNLINQARSDTERAEFTALRTRVINRALEEMASRLNEIQGIPDTLRRRRANLGDTPRDEYFKDGSGNLALQRNLRFGPAVSLFSDTSWTSTNYVDKPLHSADFGGKGAPDFYDHRVGFSVLLPLFRGRGADDFAAGERSSRLDWEASVFSAKHQAAVSVLNTVLAYWDVRAAAERVAVSRRSVELQANMLNLTRELVRAGEMPRTEENRILASHADAEARLEGSLRSLAEARVTLAIRMGVAVPDVDSAPLAAEDFASPPAAVTADAATTVVLAKEATARRYDLQASQRTREGGRVLATGARLGMRPQFNLNAQTFFRSLGERGVTVCDESGLCSDPPTTFFDTADRWIGPSANFRLDVDIPIRNDRLRGRYEQREATFQQRQIDAADLQRNIELNIARLSRAVQLAAERVRRAQEAVAQYDRTIEAEQLKLRAGDATLIDTILTEQQTTSARLTLVDAQHQYTTLLAQLRFELGQLVTDEGGESRVDAGALTTPPAALVK